MRNLRAVLLVWVAFSVDSMTPAADIPAKDRTVILISIDGFPAWMWKDPALPVPNLRRLAKEGAAAEAMTMAQRVAKSKATAFFIDENCHPQNIEVMKVRAEPLGIEIIVGDPAKVEAGTVFGAIFQYPGTYGHVRDFIMVFFAES